MNVQSPASAGLPNFRPGQPLNDAYKLNQLVAYVRSITPQKGVGTFVKRTAAGTTIDAIRKGGGSTETNQTPFQVFVDETSLVINSDSHLINTEDKDSYEVSNSAWGLETGISIDGLGVGDKIWLEIQFDSSGNLLTPFVNSGPVGSGGAWDQFPDPIQINIDATPYQETYFQIIAEITDPEKDLRPGFTVTQTDETILQITQVLDTNIALVGATTTADANEPGLPIMVAIPWNMLVTKTDGSGDTIADSSNIITPWDFGVTNPTPWHPFKVTIDSGDTSKVKVEGNSDLWKTLGTKQTITGLSAGFAVAVGDLIWLNIGINSASIIAPDNATIEHGTAWSGHPNPIILAGDTPDYQTDYNQIIAEVVATTDPRDGITGGTTTAPFKVIQHLDSALICTQWVVNGIVCMVPQPCSL